MDTFNKNGKRENSLSIVGKFVAENLKEAWLGVTRQ
jgi:hypothetical protein